MSNMTTHDEYNRQFIQEWTPSDSEMSSTHWSLSPQWLAHKKQQAEATKTETNSPAAGAANESVPSFLERYDANRQRLEVQRDERLNPKPVVVDPALVAAEQALRAAVADMLKHTRLDRVIALVQNCAPVQAMSADLILRPSQR